MYWTIKEYKEWIKVGRPIRNDVITLNISNSKIKKLEGIEKLTSLQILDCDNNHIISLEGIENLISLQTFYCENNQIISLEGIENLHNMYSIVYYGNPIEYIPPNIIRLLQRNHHIYIGQNIYHDSQSVHNHTIQ